MLSQVNSCSSQTNSAETFALAYGGAFIFGILLGWSSPAAPRLLDNDKNSFNVTKNEFSWIVAAMAIGAGMATLVSGVLRNIFGTKLTILIAAIPSALGWLLIIFAQNSEMVGVDLEMLSI